MTDVPTPQVRPARPYFSSGPCAKPPGWDASKIATESLGRSHRAKIGKTRLALCIDLMREMLQLPDTHRIGEMVRNAVVKSPVERPRVDKRRDLDRVRRTVTRGLPQRCGERRVMKAAPRTNPNSSATMNERFMEILAG